MIQKNLFETIELKSFEAIFKSNMTLAPSLTQAVGSAVTFVYDPEGSWEARPTDLSMVDVNYNELEARETANCYLIKHPGEYIFPLVYGCAIKKGVANPASYTDIGPAMYDATKPFYNADNKQISSPYIEEDLGRKAVTAEMLYDDVVGFNLTGFTFIEQEGVCFLKFECTDVPARGGNSMIAIKDENGEVMWSWHLWGYPFDIETKQINNGHADYTLMTCNLGWVKALNSEKYGTSPYYQWGRKDPMLRASSPDAPNFELAAALHAGSWTRAACATSLGQTIKNPNAFNKRLGTADDMNLWWAINSEPTYFTNYWDAGLDFFDTDYDAYQPLFERAPVKTVYDPCPVGFVIPCGNVFLDVTKEKAVAEGGWDKGLVCDGIYYPAQGFRDHDSYPGYGYDAKIFWCNEELFYHVGGSHWPSMSYYLSAGYRLDDIPDWVIFQRGCYSVSKGLNVKPMVDILR